MFDKKPVLFSCSSTKDAKELVAAASKLKSKEIIQLFDDKEQITNSILPAYANLLIRQQDKIMRSKSPQIELMLLVAKTMKIKEAIKRVGAKNKRFILFSSDKKQALAFMKQNAIKLNSALELKFDETIAEKIALAELMNE